MTVETAWLIESGESTPAEPFYLTLKYCHSAGNELYRWTWKHEDAMRFARMEDAENFCRVFMPVRLVRLAEHQWHRDPLTIKTVSLHKRSSVR